MLKIILVTMVQLFSAAYAGDIIRPAENALYPIAQEYFWPEEGKISSRIYPLIEYLEMECNSYDHYNIDIPTRDIKTMCALPNLVRNQNHLIKTILSSQDIALPKGKEWQSLFAGTVAPVLNFSNPGSWNPYRLVSAVIVQQIAIEAGLTATKRVFDIWFSTQPGMFDHKIYPAILASLYPSSHLTTYLRAATYLNCTDDYFNCVQVGQEKPEITKARWIKLRDQIQNIILEFSKVKNQKSYEGWILKQTHFRKSLNDIRETVISNKSSSLHELTSTSLIQIEELLRENLKFTFHLPPETTIDAILSLLELMELSELISKIPNLEITEEADLSEENPYFQKTQKHIENVKKYFEL